MPVIYLRSKHEVKNACNWHPLDFKRLGVFQVNPDLSGYPLGMVHFTNKGEGLLYSRQIIVRSRLLQESKRPIFQRGLKNWPGTMRHDNVWLKVRIIGLFQKTMGPQEELTSFEVRGELQEETWSMGKFVAISV